ncbi:uncharacterized protein V1510DRAFT_411671 [Dipodascopsis tothii]|uniref:uncharacterized protein n=1 Tax=Dipodascopsis tothii TaxID=44089 RepID=UPI0034CF119A
MTYRTEFPLIPRAEDAPAGSKLRNLLRGQTDAGGFSSDVGWGCMVRSAQTLLANALAATGAAGSERALVQWFADDPRAPFSVHRFVHHGHVACGKYPGEWFGPSAAARCIQILAADFAPAGLAVHVASDAGDLYRADVLRLAAPAGADGPWRPTLLLFGVRLGIDAVNSVYVPALQMCLALPQSIGIAGGRPSASHYFFAYQGHSLFYLDPHIQRKALPYHTDPAAYTADELASVHTRRVRKIEIAEMDPSMLVGFLIRDAADWRAFNDARAAFEGMHFIHISDSEPAFARKDGLADDYIDVIHADTMESDEDIVGSALGEPAADDADLGVISASEDESWQT